MKYLAVDKGGREQLYVGMPTRDNTYCQWNDHWQGISIHLPKGSIERLIGHKLTWKDKPVAFKKVFKPTPLIGH